MPAAAAAARRPAGPKHASGGPERYRRRRAAWQRRRRLAGSPPTRSRAEASLGDVGDDAGDCKLSYESLNSLGDVGDDAGELGGVQGRAADETPVDVCRAPRR